jgi:hypothetical protein
MLRAQKLVTVWHLLWETYATWSQKRAQNRAQKATADGATSV